MVTNVIDAAPPTRKYEIISGSTNAAFSASACIPLPKSHMMYFTRTSPIMRDRKTDTISTTVALKAECACDGRSARITRASGEAVPGRG